MDMDADGQGDACDQSPAGIPDDADENDETRDGDAPQDGRRGGMCGSGTIAMVPMMFLGLGWLRRNRWLALRR